MPEVPVTYAADLRSLVRLMDALDEGRSVGECGSDLYVDGATIEVANGNGYPVGTLRYEAEQWSFIAHADWADR